MKKLFSKEVKIGVCVIVALVILFFGINFLRGVNIFKASNYYFATFGNVEGLAVSSPVNLNGFKVGLVRSIEYDYEHPGNVVVEMSLDRELKLPVGTKAVLSTDMLGTSTIALDLGSETSFHMVGDKIAGVNKPGLVEALGDDLMPSVATIFPKIDTLLTNINALVINPALQASVTRLDAITADLQKTTAQLALMAKSMAPLPARIDPILSDVNKITGDLSLMANRLNSLPVDSLVDNLQATTDNLRLLSEQFTNPNSTIGQLTHNPALYNSLNATVNSLDSLLIDIKKNPKRYISIKVF